MWSAVRSRVLAQFEHRAALDVDGHGVRLAATFEDDEALFASVCERGLEGAVAKRDRDPYRPGERQWVKTKNRITARFAEERDGIGACNGGGGYASAPNSARVLQ